MENINVIKGVDCDVWSFVQKRYKKSAQVHLFELDEEFGELNDTCYHHSSGEVWHIASSPHSRDLISTCHSHVQNEVSGVSPPGGNHGDPPPSSRTVVFSLRCTLCNLYTPCNLCLTDVLFKFHSIRESCQTSHQNQSNKYNIEFYRIMKSFLIFTSFNIFVR